jgi:BlaI family transcriptional regulator, penicillinase repressor
LLRSASAGASTPGNPQEDAVARLGDLERQVMEILWAGLGSELTGRDVAARLPGHAYTTVLTVLGRLERKGLVRRERSDTTHRYSAIESREAYVAELMHEALGGTSDRDAALVRFAQTVSGKEARVLLGALERSKKSGRST